jgi:signal transduction histidine kinase
VWDRDGIVYSVIQQPFLYETTWFRLSAVAVIGLLVASIFRLRVRRIAQEFNLRLEERLAERTRIARELHDTLLGTFQAVLLKFQALTYMVLDRPEVHKELETVIDQASQAIGEGRDAVQGLRTSTIERSDLAEAIKTLGEELVGGETNPNAAEFGVAVEGEPRNLHPVVRNEVYRIAGEGMRNAFRHANAKRIAVEIRFDDRQLFVKVRDDGKGIDRKFFSGDGREGHYGLPGMRERAKFIGGQLTVRSEPGFGTEVELSIPAARAYIASTEGGHSWFAGKFFGKHV